MNPEELITTIACLLLVLLPSAIGLLSWRLLRIQGRHKREMQANAQTISALQAESYYAMRSAWLENIKTLTFANEIEVEVKLVYPLLIFLGYHEGQFSVRYKVPMQMGREQVTKEADWIVWETVGDTNKARLVVEAKHSTQKLDEAVRNQARSYAFHVGAPYYILINGQELMVYKLDLNGDQKVLHQSVLMLDESWTDLMRIVGITAT